MAAEPASVASDEQPRPAGPPIEADPVDGLPSLETEQTATEIRTTTSANDGGRGSAGRVVAANSVWRLVAFSAKAISGLVAAFLLANEYGPTGMGTYQLGATFTTIIAFAVALGLPNFLVREVARKPEDARRWVEGGIFCTLTAGVLVTGLILLGVNVLPESSSALRQVLILAGLALIFDATSQILYALFWAWQRMRFEALAILVQETVFVIATVVVVRVLDGGPSGVMAAYLGTRMVGAIVAWVVASKGLRGLIVPRFDRAFLRPTLRRAVPFAIDDALSATYIRADTLILGVMKGQGAVGLYTACTNLVLYMNVLPRMLNSALFAPLSKAWPGEPERFARLRDTSLRVLGALAMPITIGSLLLAPRILSLYGDGFEEAAWCYRMLALVIPVRMLGHTLGTALTSANGQTKRTVAVGVAAATNVVLNAVILIPLFSYNGAAVATVVTETGLFVAYAWLLSRVSGRPRIVEALTLPGVACLPLTAFVLLTWNGPLWLTVAAGAAGYALGMLGVAYAKAPGDGRRSRVRRSPRAVLASFVKA